MLVLGLWVRARVTVRVMFRVRLRIWIRVRVGVRVVRMLGLVLGSG